MYFIMPHCFHRILVLPTEISNTTNSHVQLLNQGIIATFKSCYTQCIFHSNLDENEEKSVNVPEG